MFFEILLVAIGGEPPFKEEFRKAALRNFPVQLRTARHAYRHLATIRPCHSNIDGRTLCHRPEQRLPLFRFEEADRIRYADETDEGPAEERRPSQITREDVHFVGSEAKLPL